MLTDKEVEHIAKLARIKLTKPEEEKFKKELSLILDYVKKLDELDTKNVEPLYQIHSVPQNGESIESTAGIVNTLRPDEYRKDFEVDEKLSDRLIGQAPHKENGFVKVKPVLKK